jgi:SAM-dependent methyltransferase
VVSSALTVYAEALADHAAGGAGAAIMRLPDGSARPLEVSRWIGGADAVDERALRGLCGPVLDVGCGPGRHLHALARRGVFGLGVDLCPDAVRLARVRGARAIVGSIFGDVPYAGQWRSAVLLDGNIGIGGRPARLVERVASLLIPGGAILVELVGPATATTETLVRIETASATSDWFAWAEVSSASIEQLARASGVEVGDVWRHRERWFARLITPLASR